MKNSIAIIAATAWISISEFFRNQILFKSYWIEHYQSLGIQFPEKGINGAIWGLWSLIFAIYIFFLLKKFSFKSTLIMAWLSGFVMMWMVIGNLGVFPFALLPYAIPLSVLEVILATWIIKSIALRKSV